MSGGVKFVMQIRGFDANENPITIEGVDANRVLQFSNDLIVTKDDASSPKRLVIAPRIDPGEQAEELATLTARVNALEAKQFTTTSLKIANYIAVAWEHVLVSLSAAGSMTVTLPASSGPTAGARIRVSNVSPFSGESLSIVCTFYAPAGGYYATSPYIVADDAGGASLDGASIELLDTGAGWVIVSESCKPSLLI